MLVVMVDVKNSLLMRALACKPVPRTPIWLMRQAGRYLPEYCKVRQEAGDFVTLCKTPELACEVALQPLRRYPLDAAILFSDILTIPDAQGLGLYFTANNNGPGFHNPLHSRNDIESLPSADIVLNQLHYVMETVALIRREMPAHLPLIGFAGSPWTLACYMLDGGRGEKFKSAITMMYNQPQLLHLLLEKLVAVISLYLIEQVKSGANLLMLCDAWGGLLTTANYLSFSLSAMQHIIANVKLIYPEIPIILFTKGGGQWIEAMIASGCDAISIDWTIELSQARTVANGRVAIQGNLDPHVLLADPMIIRQQVQKVLDSYGQGTGHVFNLGHGITPDINPESVAIMVDAVVNPL